MRYGKSKDCTSNRKIVQIIKCRLHIYNMMKERKRTYTEEEVNELKKWFDSQSLPPTMQIDKAAFTPNLKDTVDMLFEQAYVCYENPKMQGCLYLLEKIKSNLEKNGTGA